MSKLPLLSREVIVYMMCEPHQTSQMIPDYVDSWDKNDDYAFKSNPLLFFHYFLLR